MAEYLVISRGEDEPRVKLMTAEALSKALVTEGELAGYDFTVHVPCDLGNMPSRMVFIFKGEVVTPKPKQTVTEFEI